MSYFVTVLLQSKMPCVENVELNVLQVALVWMCSFLGENVIVLPPRNQCGRLILTKVSSCCQADP
jgi:hypothetical protein